MEPWAFHCRATGLNRTQASRWKSHSPSVEKENNMPSAKDQIRKLLDSIGDRDQELNNELRSVRERGFVTVESPSQQVLERPRFEQDLVEETIVLRTGRPVLAISHAETQFVFRDVESEVWRGRLKSAHDRLFPVLPSVGRIELQNNPRFDWVGTGWLVAENIIVTNRHVASEFSNRDGRRFIFRNSPLGRMASSIDFLQEVDNPDKRIFRLAEILHIEPDNGPDIAFLRLESAHNLAVPIELAEIAPAAEDFVAVIGYPARDSRIPEQDLMDQTFGNVYNKKRLAPGKVMAIKDRFVLHDCSTLGGNSGSVVLSLSTGKAVALHFSGRFLEANYAVPAALVAERLHTISHPGYTPSLLPSSSEPPPTRATEQTPAMTPDGQVTFQLPLTVTINLGSPKRSTSVPASGSHPASPIKISDSAAEMFVEGRVEDYSEREGYKEHFLGKKFLVPLPTLPEEDVVTFTDSNGSSSILRYEHFSVAMNRSRRMCFYSAVNINGDLSRRMKRSSWKIDPRIPKELQMMKECYGNPPKFSRGHMTRREDPIWGPPTEAARGNEDSMHVTNVVPQMQPFNAPIWLGLENYALENARQDEMLISVFTGPFFTRKDPIMFGVKIPTSFWKIIAFIHDDTEELCATGYTMSQDSSLRDEEFVFGQYETSQIPISTIGTRSGLGFELLTSVDPMRSNEEAASFPLSDFAQIKFY
jgi:endonuclease G